MRVRAADALPGEPVHPRRLHPARTVAAQVAVTQVVEKEYYNIWPLPLGRSAGAKREKRRSCGGESVKLNHTED